MTTEQKFCIKCKWIGTNSSRNPDLYRCFAPSNKKPTKNLVTGEDTYYHFTCYEARLSHNINESCGEYGVWFEEAPPKKELDFPSGYSANGYANSSTDLLTQLEQMK
jgi:hypothetical protein